MSTAFEKAVAAIERHGVLLLYPVGNKPDPRSLWSALHPRSVMRWAWDESADPRVVALWHLRTALSKSKRVVYGKWLTGRATFFSRDAFVALLATLRAQFDLRADLGGTARRLLDVLLDDSPLATGALRVAAGLEGRLHEAELARGMKKLWSRLLIAGAGEEEEGGFPSLAVGATELVHEDLWDRAATLGPEDEARVAALAEASPAVARGLKRLRASLRPLDDEAP